ncbi:MAG: PAS domain S-box protein [Rhodospirillaceae bacterium]|nr:PAS domain S-box protein [Rhodospirillaceae bacterium]
MRASDGGQLAEAGSFLRGTLDALGICIAALDATGRLIAANRAWRDLTRAGGGPGDVRVGDNFLEMCDQATSAGNGVAGEVASGIRAVIAGTLPTFSRRQLRCAKNDERWFDLRVEAIEADAVRHFLLTLDDSTERFQALDVMRESAARHQHAERIARLGHWRLVTKAGDWQHGTIEYSPQAIEILGLGQLPNADTLEALKAVIHPDDVARVLDLYETHKPDGYVVEYRIIRPDGSIATVQETGETVHNAAKDVNLEFGTLQDVTVQRSDADRLRQLNDDLERQVLERTAALTQRESQLHRAQALAHIGHYTWHRTREKTDGGIWHTGLRYSAAAASIFGVTPAELEVIDDDYVSRFVHPADHDSVLHAYRHTHLERLRNRLPLEYRIIRADGEIRHVVEIIEQMAGDETDVIEALGMIQDITDRKLVELALRQSEARLNAFMDHAPFIMSIKDIDGRLQMINREGSTSYHASQEKLIGHLTDELIPNEAGRTIAAMSKEVIATGAEVTREVELPQMDRYHWSLEIEFPIRDAAGAIASIGGFAVDITERKQAELKLRESEARLRAIFDHAPITLSLRDTDGRFIMVNTRFLEYFAGPDRDVIGRLPSDIFDAQHIARVDHHIGRLVNSLKPETYEARTQTALGPRDFVVTHFPITDDFGVLSAVGTIALDITPQRAAEAALHQAQKMEVVGQLTGGIAHDFNNLLGAIIGNLDLLALDIGDQPRALELQERAMVAAERGAALVHRLLAFSRRQTLLPQLLDVNDLIQGMQTLLVHSLGGGLEVSIRTLARRATTLVDPAQLEAAVLNLAINARDAMPTGGSLVIETSDIQLAGGQSDAEQPGHYVVIAVSDSGSGMSAETLSHVFEPFFTTKPVGKGTGLGLSMVHGFVKQSGGFVRIDSELGQGTRVSIFLPCAGSKKEALAAEDDLDQIFDGPGRGETILVVEDDLDVFAYVISALQKLGYRCIGASDAAEALAQLAAHKEIALLLPTSCCRAA